MKLFEENPQYEQIVWSGFCAPHTLSGRLCDEIEIAIVETNGKYGLVYLERQEGQNGRISYRDYQVCDCCYDAICKTASGTYHAFFTVFLDGKCGLLEIICLSSDRKVYAYRNSVPCVYNAIESGNVFFLFRDDGIRYFDPSENFLSETFCSLYVDNCFIFANKNETEQIVIDKLDNRIILTTKDWVYYRCEYHDGFVFYVLEGAEDRMMVGYLIFYNRNTYQITKTKTYKNLCTIVRSECCSESMLGFSYVEDGREKQILVPTGFTQCDVEELQLHKKEEL